MKVALKVSGLYVSAEQGGGIDTRLLKYPPALIANRDAIGPWETFEIEKVDETHVALKTCDGYYVTAEGGGGSYLRTNATTRGVWETFGWLQVGNNVSLITWDGIHMLGAAVAELNVVNARHVWQGFGVEVLEAPAPPLPDLRVWKGLFCIPDAFGNIPWGDGHRIWTPAYGCYDDYWRGQIRAAYTDRGYTHFPYNCAGLPYANDYPELADDAARVARDLAELESAGIVPVVFATDDRNPWVLCQSFVANAKAIKVCVPVWEMNGPLGDSDKAIEEQNCKDAITRTRNAAPHADCYLHFTPGHGSISYASEMGGWQWCQANGTVGLLAQGDNRFAAEDPVTGGEGLESTAIRLAGRVDLGAPAGWAGMHQLTVKFEYGIYDMYHGHVNEDELCDYTMQFLAHAPTVVGYCDGGR